MGPTLPTNSIDRLLLRPVTARLGRNGSWARAWEAPCGPMAADRAGRFHELDPSWHLMQIAGLGVSNLGRRSRGVTAWMPRQPRIQSPALAACRL